VNGFAPAAPLEELELRSGETVVHNNNNSSNNKLNSEIEDGGNVT
jgi:hypothetical protein